MAKTAGLLGGILVVVAIPVVALASSTGIRPHEAATGIVPPALVRAQYSTIITAPPGLTAIRSGSTATHDQTATFTQVDVTRYLTTHPLFQSTTAMAPTIAKILFIPAAQASAMLNGEPIGRPDAALVCYVEVQGDLSMRDIDGPSGLAPDALMKPAHKGVLIFDAQTGNLLLRGFNG